ncbi:MAG: molybdenum cofactor biosynthesis protein MoaE [Desulfobulbaceae bacterium]|jgi:molybdopterin synthase catalytic subunit|nr:molybdenum cofactor biosynthesis protein MoaE [Desulfobulbaceae bacterium]MDY0351590.1 molybdenum cofactor biosynthesis protein MoaE [Desulfobulbaceae bacterium]
MIDEWIAEVKQQADPRELGMILVHNGLVRATAKNGKEVRGINLATDRNRLAELIRHYSALEGIEAVRAWINEGRLAIGDPIMYVLVAGRFRTDVLPAFEALIGAIKNEVVTEQEY